MNQIRRIAHLDMDAFYASVELLRYPQLKHEAVVVGGGAAIRAQLQRAQGSLATHDIPVASFPRLKDYTGRGVLTTANYIARGFGVGSAMGTMKAAKLCPQAILLPVDFEEYRRYSKRFKEIIVAMAPSMENRGVDEVYIDFTHVPGGQREGGYALARRIQQSIFQATGLTCSIGVAPNKLLAKMASEFNKPNGISVIGQADLQQKIWPLAARKINGIGPKADEKLQAMGVQTIGQLAAQDKAALMQRFGKTYGAWMHAAAWGQDDRPLDTDSAPVSMSRETTFERDLHATHDKATLTPIFTALCESVAQDLQRKGYRGRTIGIKIRWTDFKITTRDVTIHPATDDPQLIRRTAAQALRRLDLSQRFRLLGVRVSKLEARQAHRHPQPVASEPELRLAEGDCAQEALDLS
jgi:DNA polymerase IV